MYQNPEDKTRLRRLQKHFQSPHTKTKSPILSNYTRMKTEGEKRQTEVIRKQMIDRMFFEKQLSRRNYNSNSPYSNGLSNNQHFVDHSYSSRRTDHRHQSNNSSRNSATESQIRLRLSQRQNETLFQMLTKSEQQISILKQLLKQKQSAIHDKQKIIRRFIKQRVKYSEEEKYDNHVQDELLNSNITIQSLKAEILKHLATQNLMRQKIYSLQKKIPIIQFPNFMKDKQYQQIIKQKQNELEKIQTKTLELKTDCEGVQNIKAQNNLLKQKLKTYESQQTNNCCPSSPINRISNKFQQKLNDTQAEDIHTQDMIRDLIQKLANVNYKLKQKEAYCDKIQQREEDLKKQIHLKQQQINKLQRISCIDERDPSQKSKKQQIELLKQKISQLQNKIIKQTTILQQNSKHLSDQIKILTKKNIQLNENVILNLSELDSIEKYNEQLKQELKKQSNMTKQYKQQIQIKNNQIKRIIGEIKKKQDLEEGNKQLKIEIDFLKKVNCELERRVSYRDKRQEDLEVLNKEYLEKIKIQGSKIEELEKKIQQLELKLSQYENNIKLLSEQNSILNKSIQSLKQKYQTTLSQLSSLEKTNQNLIQLQQSSNNQIKILSTTISQQSKSINLFQTKIQSLTNQLQIALTNLQTLQQQTSNTKQQFQTKLQYLHNELSIKQLLIKQQNNKIISLNNIIKQKQTLQLQNSNKQKNTEQIKNQNRQLLLKTQQLQKVVQQKNVQISELKDKFNIALQQNNRLVKGNKWLVNQTQQSTKQISQLKKEHQQQIVLLKKQIQKQMNNYSQLIVKYQQLLVQKQNKQMKKQIMKSQQSQCYQHNENEDELKNKMLQNERKYSQLLLEQQNQSYIQTNKNKQQIKSTNNIQQQSQNKQQQIIKLIKQLSIFYHSDFKTFIQKSLADQNIVLVGQQKQSQKKRVETETETTCLQLTTNQVAKTTIYELVTNILKNNSLIDTLNKFLYNIIEQYNIIISEKVIIQLCNSLKQFEDEIEKRVNKINGFLKNSSDAFEFNSNIEQSEDQNNGSYIKEDQNFDYSFKQEEKIQECSISYQSQLGETVKEQNNCSIQYQQSFKSLIPPTKKVQFSLNSSTSIRPMSQHSKLSSIKLKLFEEDQKSGSQLVSESSLSANNFKDDYQKKLKNKMMHISRDPYKKGKKNKK